jgi:hypothetical protein
MLKLRIQVWTFLLILFTGGYLCAQFQGYPGNTYDRSLKSIRLDSVDLSGLSKEMGSRSPGYSETQINQLLIKNFRYIFMNQLNRSRFLVAPKPQLVVNHIVNILDKNRNLEEIIEEGNRILESNHSSDQMRRFIEQVRASSKDLNNSFFAYFVEAQHSTYSVTLPSEGEPKEEFLSYLRQSREIKRELDRSLERYFFNSSPSSISLNEFESSSISVLCKSLLLLSERFSKYFDQK